jgi:bacteriorhodopsin
MSALVALTTRASVLIQFLTGAVGVYGLTLPLAPEDKALNQVLLLEMIVQVIEFVFYLGFLMVFDLVSLTQSRYFDWFLSTPIMLFTMALYFTYERRERDTESLTVEGFTRSNWQPLLLMVLLNAAMLACGFAAEHGWIPRWLAFVAGSAFLSGAFWILYREFAVGLPRTEKICGLMFGLWASYGLAFLAPVVAKNVAYNVLDLVSKNFFGVFLFVEIARKSAAIKETESGGHDKAAAKDD